MPSISDEAGIKLLNILEMFGREMLRNKINESNRLRAEARDAKAAAKGLSNNGKGMKKQDYTTTWFDSPAEAQTTLRELKQISPKLFANSTVVGHFLVHPKDGKDSKGKHTHTIQDAIYDISRDHRYAARIINLDKLDKGEADKGYIKSLPDGDCTRFTFGEFENEASSFNAAYYCSVLQDYDINARHIGNQVIVNVGDRDRALEALDIEGKKIQAMGPERGELFMRQRYKDRIGVEFEPPLIEDGTDGYDEAGGDMGVDMPTSEVEPEHGDDNRADADERADEGVDPDHDVRDPDDGGVFAPSLDDVDETRGEESPAGNAADEIGRAHV